MNPESVVIDVGEDRAALSLARVLLVCQIASQVLACYMLVEMVERGQLSAKASWYWRRWRQQVRERQVADHEWRLAVGETLFQAEQIVKEGANG